MPIFCPVGNKPSSCLDSEPFPPGMSPDKGAVCVALTGWWNVLFVSMHLQGTNRYGISEVDFDIIRRRQLDSITERCQEQLGAEVLGRLAVVVAGDLNFRCEVHTEPEDKTRGGKDFQAVNNIVMSEDVERVRQLFQRYDRLLHYLGRFDPVGEDSDAMGKRGTAMERLASSAGILKDVDDIFWWEWCLKEENHSKKRQQIQDSGEKIILPTFTFPVGRMHPRPYSDKRTPAWTDRILVSQVLLNKPTFRVISIGARFEVCTSDHAPVHCFMILK